VIQTIIEFFLAKRVHVGVLAFTLSWAYMHFLGIKTDSSLSPYVAFFIVWSAYLENLTTDKKEDALTQSPHGIDPAVEQRLFPIENYFVIGYGIALFLSILIGTHCAIATSITIIAFSSYVQKWFPFKNNESVRLKDIYIVKNLTPPIGWTLSTFIIPLLASKTTFSLELTLFSLAIFLCSFREEIKFDIPDAQGDKKAGIKTFPNTLKESTTKTILHTIMAIIALFFYTALFLLYKNQNHTMLNALLENIYIFTLYFLVDHTFVKFLFKNRKKEYCNIGIVWLLLFLISYVLIPFPYNALIIIPVRLVGGFIFKKTKIVAQLLPQK